MKFLALLEGWIIFVLSMWICRMGRFFEDATFNLYGIITVLMGIGICIITFFFIMDNWDD